MTLELEDRVALVTGGGTGIGRAVALSLAEAGCRVAIAGRRTEKLLQTAASASDATLFCVSADIGERDQVKDLVARVNDELGPIDILVNAAGMNVPDRAVETVSLDSWERLLRVNATGAFLCAHACLPSMVERRGGLIVNISSIAGLRAGPMGGIAYNASKFAMSAMGTTIGAELGEKGIRVTNIYPGETNTPILDNRPKPPDADYRAALLQPEDVAAAVLMVARLHPRARVPDLVITPTHYRWI